MLSFRVVKKLQRDVLLVNMEQHQPDESAGETSGVDGKKLHLLRILTLPAKDATTSERSRNDSSPAVLLLRPKEKLLKELSSFRSVTRERAECFCRPDHASVQLLPAPTHDGNRATANGEAECQVHIFTSVDCPVGLRQHALSEAVAFLPKDEETGWRLLASLVEALHTLHFAPPKKTSPNASAQADRSQSAGSETQHRPFYSYYGELTEADVSVYTTASGRSFRHDAPEYLDETSSRSLRLEGSNGGRSHALQFALDVPKSVYYKVFSGGDGELKGSNYWASEDIRAVGTIVRNCCSESQIDPESGLKVQVMGSGFSQEFRFLLDKMCHSDPSTRPSASQILSFQAVALRLRSWGLQQTMEQQQREIHRLRQENTALKRNQSSGVGLPRSPAPEQQIRSGSGRKSGSSGTASESPNKTPGSAESELRLRQERVEHREAKIQLFLELYNLTTSQLDQMPTTTPNSKMADTTAEVATRRDFQQHLHHQTQQHQDSRSVATSQPREWATKHGPGPVGMVGPRSGTRSNASSRSPGSSETKSRPASGGAGGGSQTMGQSSTPVKQQTSRYQQAFHDAPPSPELSPLPKQSEYGSHVGTPINEALGLQTNTASVHKAPTTTVVSNTILGPSLTKADSAPPMQPQPASLRRTEAPQPSAVEAEVECEVIEMEVDFPTTPKRPDTRPDTAAPGATPPATSTQGQAKSGIRTPPREWRTPSGAGRGRQMATPPSQKPSVLATATPNTEQRKRRFSRDRAGGEPMSDVSNVTPSRVKRSPSADDQRANYDWMSAHLSDLESMQRTLNDPQQHGKEEGDKGGAESRWETTPAKEDETALAQPVDPIVAKLMSLVQEDASTAQALHQLRAQVKTQEGGI